MKMIIVVGDRHSGDGSVITGSDTTDIDGKAVARIGDKAICRKHAGTYSIITGDPSWIIDGKAAACHGDKLACGCSLFSGQQQRVSITAGGSEVPRCDTQPSVSSTAGDLRHASVALPYPQAAHISVCKSCLLSSFTDAAAFLRR